MINRTGYLALVLILLNVSLTVAQDIDVRKTPKGVVLPVPKIVRSQFRTSALSSVQIFEENFETGGAGWSRTGSWEIGAPTSGPNSGHNSTNLAATDLDANYSNSTDDWLISPTISLPSLTNPAAELKLYFWEWFSTESGYDEIRVKISTDNGSSWTELSSKSGSSSDWIETMHDLTVYAGQSVKLGFNLTPDFIVTREGWYIDDIRVEIEEPQPLEALCVSLNHQSFPFIFLNVAVDTFSTGISSLTSSNFQVFENNVLQTEHFNVVPPQSGGGTRIADIVFIMDNSGSMSDEQAAIRNNVIDFVDNLSASGINFALGLTRYGGESGGIPIFEDNGVLTTDPVYFKDNVWLRNNISGGSEPGYLAMVRSASNFSFRPGAQRIFIIITDETPDQGGATLSEAINALQDGSITLFALIESDEIDEFEPITDATNGKIFDIFSNFDEILTFIVAQVSNTYVVSYYSSDPFKNGVNRLVEVVVNYNSEQVTCSSGSYIPGSAPKIQRTLTTLGYHNQAWTAGTSFTIEVEITDEASPLVQNASLFYKNTTDITFNSVSMTNSIGDYWEASIPSGFAQDPGVDYYVTATASVSTVSDPSSDPISNPYQIAILPNEAPQITHTPVTELTAGVAISITAEIVDITNSLSETILQYRKQGQLIYQEADMINTSGDSYQSDIPASYVTSDGLEYYIKATDDFGVSSSHGTPDNPHLIGGIEPPPTSLLYLYPNPTYLLSPSFDLTSDVMLTVEKGENVLGIEADISYDPSLVEITGFAPHDFLSANGAIITDLSTYDNLTGLLNVQLTAAGGSPPGVTGDGSVAKITFKSKVVDPTSNLLLTGASLRDPANVSTIPGMQNGAFVPISDLLFDLDSDNDVDFADFTLLVAYWNEDPDNLSGDIVGPITGIQPGLPPWSKTNYLYPGDGVIDFEDQVVFTLMYNWYKQQTDT
ncbi:MAG: choice-of-anchor J domain-containing protein, partial [Candidatus Marinimicrobia bacterium]|nr:choice-of-anchor J domain-containing protein [Candidatus Neomarinimicrobiota bacterium]